MSSPLEPLPEIDLRHLQRLTDDTGIYQHALYATPDADHGYCIDDNARALIAALYHAQLRGLDESAVPLHTYLAFLAYAYNPDTRQFRNFMAFDRSWLEDSGSHDSQGRNIWALGLTVKLAPTASIRGLAAELYRKALPALEGLDYLRSWAFSVQGIDAFLDVEPEDDDSTQAFETHANKLFDAYTRHAQGDWLWWEDLVVYDNAKLPHALLLAGRHLNRPDMTQAGLVSLRWLLEQQLAGPADAERAQQHLSIIGNDGWLQRGQPRSKFDQQPLEAYALVDACLEAARVVEDSEQRTRWEADARLCFEWFTGRNDLKASLFDPETGGGRDGLEPDGVNQNQGAESSLAYLLSVLEMHRYAAGH